MAATTYINHTSLRCRPLHETLKYAREYAGRCGITRVTDTTRLDQLGIPVFASIRPGAADGTICVNSGKGILPDEARVGAYMEAIEFALAEPNRAGLEIVAATPREMLDGQERPEAILDFCPRVHADIPLDEPLTAVYASDLSGSPQLLVPAELAFVPYTHDHPKYFGSDTNGLSSGNSLAEAQIHGILEVIERDILSFQTVLPTYQRVEPASYPEVLLPTVEKIESARLELIVKYGSNDFGIPFFSATIIDHDWKNPLYINGGYGCHTNKAIALNRAVSEAVQSRLAFIHGGRDDLIRNYRQYEGLSFTQQRELFHRSVNAHRDLPQSINFGDIREINWPFQSLEEYRNDLLNLLRVHGFDYVLCVPFTKEEEPLQVVKIIIPRMEFFSKENPRLGPRLKDYATQVAHYLFRRS